MSEWKAYYIGSMERDEHDRTYRDERVAVLREEVLRDVAREGVEAT